jgi:hypothetical protein
LKADADWLSVGLASGKLLAVRQNEMASEFVCRGVAAKQSGEDRFAALLINEPSAYAAALTLPEVGTDAMVLRTCEAMA